MPSAQRWKKLPKRVTTSDVITVELTSQENSAIDSYGDAFFDKKYTNTRPTTYSTTYNLGNSNSKGIKGEFAVLRHYCPDAVLADFLSGRPYKRADKGDAIIATPRFTKVFDTKSRNRPYQTLEELCTNDIYCAEMDNVYLEPSHDYLEGFIFCAGNLVTGLIHIMGWMLREEAQECMELIPKGKPVPPKGYSYVTPERIIPYSRLHPMSELDPDTYIPLDAAKTLLRDEELALKKTAYATV